MRQLTNANLRYLFLSAHMALELNVHLLRHFLRSTNFQDGEGILHAACALGEPAAVQILLLGLKIRANPRTRRTFRTVVRAMRQSARPRWLNVLGRHLYGLYCNLGLLSLPLGHQPTPAVHFSRRQVRALAGTGLVREDKTSLEERATIRSRALYQPSRSLNSRG